MRKVVFSLRASNRLDLLLEFLEHEWSPKVKDAFIKKLDKSFQQIQRFPGSCPHTDAVKGLHMLVVTKQTSVYYRFDSKTIKVVTIFDNRMNPEKLKRELK